MAREGRSRYWEFLGLYFLHHYHELHGNTQASREALDQFIGLCAEEGYEFFFYRDMGAIAVETLLRLLRLDIMPGYVSQIIANLPGEAKDAIVGLLSHNDVEIRLAALSACALLDMGHARRAFRKALSDSSVLVRRRARKLNAALPPERPRYEFHSLGSFEVMRGGIALPLSSWPRKKAKNLFKYLLANEGRMIALEQILEEFWPDMQPEKAILNLRTTLNNLRRAIEPHIKGGQISDLIFTTDRTMGLIIREPHFWDVRAFREKASWGRTYTAQGDLAKALEVYEEGLALYRGDFLEENVYDDWARAVRSEIRELHLQVLENCASCHLGRGQTSQALTRFRQLLAHEPFREDIHRTIIELYLRLENRNAALEQYRQFREILSELDIEPPQETKDLVEKILKVRIDAAR
jgi:DNA-binding SARP family transcriptional activator